LKLIDCHLHFENCCLATGDYGNIIIGNEFISQETLEMSFMGIDNSVKITIVTTPCYSGIWAVLFVNPRATIMAATTGNRQSFAFSASNSGFAQGGFLLKLLLMKLPGFCKQNHMGWRVLKPHLWVAL
jgi:hypothetical protein